MIMRRLLAKYIVGKQVVEHDIVIMVVFNIGKERGSCLVLGLSVVYFLVSVVFLLNSYDYLRPSCILCLVTGRICVL